jgi:ribonuclease E
MPAEPPRRRSTVREPAPFAFDDGASPLAQPETPVGSAPAPAATPEPDKQPPQAEQEPQPEQPQEDAGKPRRTGWWAKRVLGG